MRHGLPRERPTIVGVLVLQDGERVELSAADFREFVEYVDDLESDLRNARSFTKELVEDLERWTAAARGWVVEESS